MTNDLISIMATLPEELENASPSVLKKRIVELMSDVQTHEMYRKQAEKERDDAYHRAYAMICDMPITMLKELCTVDLYMVAIVKEKLGHKCSKCDKDRYIHFKSPRGTELKEKCKCADKVHVVFDVLPLRLQTIRHVGEKLKFVFTSVEYSPHSEYMVKYLPSIEIPIPNSADAVSSLYYDSNNTNKWLETHSDTLGIITNIYHGQDFKELPFEDYTLFEKEDDAKAYKRYLEKHYKHKSNMEADDVESD